MVVCGEGTVVKSKKFFTIDRVRKLSLGAKCVEGGKKGYFHVKKLQ